MKTQNLLLIGLLGVGGYFLYQRMNKKKPCPGGCGCGGKCGGSTTPKVDDSTELENIKKQDNEHKAKPVLKVDEGLIIEKATMVGIPVFDNTDVFSNVTGKVSDISTFDLKVKSN